MDDTEKVLENIELPNTPPLFVKENGKITFIGKDSESNPPVRIKNPSMRYCAKCFKETANDSQYCQFCSTPFDDAKLECPVCHHFFDYLLGDIKQGCEGCYDPLVDKPEIVKGGTNGPT
jgi:hypothetical protein